MRNLTFLSLLKIPFPSERTILKLDLLQDRKIYCHQACECDFQPGSFTGCGSEGVKVKHSYEREGDGNKVGG